MKKTIKLIPAILAISILAILILSCAGEQEVQQPAPAPEQTPQAAAPEGAEPLQPATEPVMEESSPETMPESGCWVKIYSRTDYEGNEIKIPGPGSLNLEDIPGIHDVEWGDHINSLIVGPEASLLVLGTGDFEGEELALGPGEEVPDLAMYPIQGNIGAMAMECLAAMESPAEEMPVEEE